ncbi:hypothetical protein EV126DRAFT_23464 [Verticillium dahliae]|nr:hypothetical protein EV126DRAFT_23464 [Verticillium dahliae]
MWSRRRLEASTTSTARKRIRRDSVGASSAMVRDIGSPDDQGSPSRAKPRPDRRSTRSTRTRPPLERCKCKPRWRCRLDAASHDGDADWTLLRYRMRMAEGERDSRRQGNSRRQDNSQHSTWLARVGVVGCSAASTPTDAKARHSATRRRLAIGASPPARRSRARKLGKWMTLPLALDPIGRRMHPTTTDTTENSNARWLAKWLAGPLVAVFKLPPCAQLVPIGSRVGRRVHRGYSSR